jgi:hypothetical protein
MTQVQTILRGAKSPEACRFALTPGALDLDMTDVSAVSLEVRQCDGVVQSWVTTIDAGATAALVTVAHTFDAAGLETDHVGRYAIVATATTPDGPVRFGPFYLVVSDWGATC